MVGLQKGKDKNRLMASWTIELQSYHTGVVLPWFVGWPQTGAGDLRGAVCLGACDAQGSSAELQE